MVVVRIMDGVEPVSYTHLILFIDELHTVIGAGRGEGSMDAANILKPALARGEVRCIGCLLYTSGMPVVGNCLLPLRMTFYRLLM